MRIVLASASPRRAAVLRDAGIPFQAVPTRVDESPRPGESPQGLVRRLAETKARAAATQVSSEAERIIVIGADTEVVLRNPAGARVLGKPASAEEAQAMLRGLSGRAHEVITGLAVLRLPDGRTCIESETTRVTFAPLTEEEIADYVNTGEPFDKAGAYAIQGFGGRFVIRVEGCHFNVVGLPLARLYRILQEFGWPQGS